MFLLALFLSEEKEHKKLRSTNGSFQDGATWWRQESGLANQGKMIYGNKWEKYEIVK